MEAQDRAKLGNAGFHSLAIILHTWVRVLKGFSKSSLSSAMSVCLVVLQGKEESSSFYFKNKQ